MDNEKLSALLREIREYGAVNKDLQQAHHFLFCKKNIRSKQSKNVVVMGFNPGETPKDWESTNGNRSEETFEFDFHAEKRTAASKKWMSNIDFFLPNHNVYLTEFFFWSSKNISELEERYGKIEKNNPHIEFCKKMNLELLRVVEPDFVVFTGVTHYKIVANIYDLVFSGDLISERNQKLAITATSSICPWIFTRHWSGSFGFSNSDKLLIKKKIENLLI